MPTYESETVSRDDLQRIRKSQVCAVCGEWLNVFLGDDGKAFVACHEWVRSHHEGIAKSYQEPKQLNIPVWREEMEKEHGKETATALDKYYPQGALTQSQAMHILKLVFPRAPEDEIVRCAILCRDFSLHPLKKEVYLIPFNVKQKDNTYKEEWATVIGIAADRKIASNQKGNYSFLDDTPRAATVEEITKQFGEGSEEAQANVISICKLKGESGNQAVGFGLWPKTKEPYGIEKGNTKRNMANIRAERQATSRLPGRPLPQVDVIDESYAELPDVSVVDTSTGEILELPSVTEPQPSPEPPESKSEPLPQESKGNPPANPWPDMTFDDLIKYVKAHGKTEGWLFKTTSCSVQEAKDDPYKVATEIKDIAGW